MFGGPTSLLPLPHRLATLKPKLRVPSPPLVGPRAAIWTDAGIWSFIQTAE